MLRSLLLKMFQKMLHDICWIEITREREREREGDFGCIIVTKSVHISYIGRMSMYILYIIIYMHIKCKHI